MMTAVLIMEVLLTTDVVTVMMMLMKMTARVKAGLIVEDDE